MLRKPTYKELEQRNKDLEKEAVNCKRTEEALRECENRFKNVTNSIKELLVLLDQNFKIQLINSTLAQAYNVSLDEYAGKHCYELFYGRNDICEGCPAIKVLNEGKVTRGALRYRPDGRIFDRTVYPFIDDDGNITGAIVIGCDVTQQKQTEKALRKSEKKYRTLLETTSEGCWMINHKLKTIEVNQALCKMLGYSQDEMLGKTSFDFVDDENRKIFIEQTSKIPDTEHRSYEITLKKKNGQDLHTYFNATTIRDESGEVQSSFAFIKDITERKILEAQMLHSQKMEAIGTLAGGIAHEFNNLMTTIIGNVHMLLMSAGEDHSLIEGLEDIKYAGERAADLTRQILAFSRKQMIRPKVLDLNEVLTDLRNMLERVIEENIELKVICEPALRSIKIDPAQLGQVIINLVTNARDAMPKGGRLTIETANVALDDNFFRNCTLEEISGSYVMLSVRDTGIGMDPKAQEHIFEPFYTTKEVDKGTGLGLSTVYGIVKQNQGRIWVDSEPGRGSTFKVYLPAVEINPELLEKE